MQLHKLKKLPSSILCAKTKIIPPQVHTRVYLYSGAYLHTGVYLYTGAYLHIGVYLYTGAYLHTEVYLYSRAYLHIGVYLYAGAYLYIGVYLYTSDICLQQLWKGGEESVTTHNQRMNTCKYAQLLNFHSLRNTSIATDLFFVSDCPVIIVPDILILRQAMHCQWIGV